MVEGVSLMDKVNCCVGLNTHCRWKNMQLVHFGLFLSHLARVSYLKAALPR